MQYIALIVIKKRSKDINRTQKKHNVPEKKTFCIRFLQMGRHGVKLFGLKRKKIHFRPLREGVSKYTLFFRKMSPIRWGESTPLQLKK